MKTQKLPFYLIGISGGSASGKSVFIKSLRQIFSERQLCIISQDDYYKKIDQQQTDEFGYHNFDLLESIDSQLMHDDLITLASGKEVLKKEYVFELKDKVPAIKIYKPAPVVIVEGIFIFSFPEISKLFDLSVFIDCDSESRFERRLKRDVKERGIPEEKVLHQWKHHVIPAHKAFVKPYRKAADIIVNNYESMERSVEILSDHIRAILNLSVK